MRAAKPYGELYYWWQYSIMVEDLSHSSETVLTVVSSHLANFFVGIRNLSSLNLTVQFRSHIPTSVTLNETEISAMLKYCIG